MHPHEFSSDPSAAHSPQTLRSVIEPLGISNASPRVQLGPFCSSLSPNPSQSKASAGFEVVFLCVAIAKLVHLSVAGRLAGDDLVRRTPGPCGGPTEMGTPLGSGAVMSYHDATLL